MIETKLENFSSSIEKILLSSMTHKNTNYDSVYRAMEYSLLAGGKRLRPFILNEFYKAAGGKDDNALYFAAALEMIHTYSLVHDDLPCMDNDDLRRGKASCHKVFGEDIALLAGDNLLTLAFETALKTSGIDAEKINASVSVLAKCAGGEGMIGGQVIDLESENNNNNTDLSVIKEMYIKKTGALIASAAVIGVILAGGDANAKSAAEKYALNLGTAFQIQDDILDAVGDSAILGKPVGSDDKNKKSTYVSLVGMEKAESDIKAFTDSAISALEIFGSKADTLKDLAIYLANRNN